MPWNDLSFGSHAAGALTGVKWDRAVVCRRTRERPISLKPAVPSSTDQLTQRESELLRTFAEGKSYKEAARMLGISPQTVGTYAKTIYRKLEVNSRSDAIREGFRS